MSFLVLDTSAGTGKLCILGHLGLVFIWSCFVSCLLFLLFYVSLRNLCSGTCRKIPSIYQLFVPHYGRIYVYLFNNELHYRMNKQREMSFEFSSNLSTVDLSKHLIIAWIIRKFIQLVNFVTFSVFYFFLGEYGGTCMSGHFREMRLL